MRYGSREATARNRDDEGMSGKDEEKNDKKRDEKRKRGRKKRRKRVKVSLSDPSLPFSRPTTTK